MSSADFALARYNPDGSLDAGFGTGGKVTTDFGGFDVAFGVALQTDGKTVAAGQGGPGSDFALARYEGDTAVITVPVDIEPGESPNAINPGSNGTTPVAILSTGTFNAPSQVDTSSLEFGRTGTEASLAFWAAAVPSVPWTAHPDSMAGPGCGAETHGMKRIAVLLALVLLGGGSGQAASGPLITTDAQLPARGLLVARGHDTLLVGLDGRVRARLADLRPWWFASGETARNAAFQQLAAIVPGSDLLSGHGQWYLFDSRGHLDILTSPRLRLPGGIDIVAHTVPTNDHVFQVDITVERAGRVVVPASAETRRISGNLAVGQSIAVDLQTANRWRVASNCYPVVAKGTELLMFCGTKLLAVSTSGLQKTLATIPKSLFATSANVSPNGRYVVGLFTPGCGPSYGFIVPTDGGVARPLSGERSWTVAGPNSIALGWTADNRIVTIVQPSSRLDTEPKAGVYLIDPATLTRRLVYPSAKPWAMWNPAGT